MWTRKAMIIICLTALLCQKLDNLVTSDLNFHGNPLKFLEHLIEFLDYFLPSQKILLICPYVTDYLLLKDVDVYWERFLRSESVVTQMIHKQY